MMETEKPLVSIITGCYNHEDIVEDSIRSLLAQSYTNIEVIAFDDCSTDSTASILNTFEIDPRFRLINHDHNIGFVKGLINAIKIAKGEFIAIHGSGDYSFPTRIEQQVNVLINKQEIGVVGCENELYSRGKYVNTTKWYPAGNFLLDIQQDSIKISHGDVMFRKSVYDQVEGYRFFFRYAQDRDLWCRMALVTQYYIVPNVLYRRQRHLEGSVSGTPTTRIKQIFYSQMALSCLTMRKKYGYDYVDILGPEAFALVNRTAMVSNTLARYFFQLIRFEKYEDLVTVYDVIKTQKQTFLSLAARLVHNRIIPLSSIRYFINTRKRLKKIRLFKPKARNSYADR